MSTQKLVEALDRVAEIFGDLAQDLRDGPQDVGQGQVDAAPAGREVEADPDAPADGDVVEVTYGDLWRLVNRSRKMIRFAREGKVPSQDQRAPLCRAIKALKQQGAVKKPRNPRD